MSGDHTEFRAFIRRVLAAYGRRCAEADAEDLAEMLALSVELDEVIERVVVGLRARGLSWAEIGRPLGVTRQAAQQRFGRQGDVDPGGAA